MSKSSVWSLVSSAGIDGRCCNRVLTFNTVVASWLWHGAGKIFGIFYIFWGVSKSRIARPPYKSSRQDECQAARKLRIWDELKKKKGKKGAQREFTVFRTRWRLKTLLFPLFVVASAGIFHRRIFGAAWKEKHGGETCCFRTFLTGHFSDRHRSSACK